MDRIKSLDKYVFNKLDIPLNRDYFEYEISRTIYEDTIQQHKKTYSLRNLAVDYLENNIDKKEYLSEKESIENIPVSENGDTIFKYEIDTIKVPIQNKCIAIEDIYTYDIIERELHNEMCSYLKHHIKGYEEETIDDQGFMFNMNRGHNIIHNFQFDTNIGTKIDLLPIDSFIILEKMSNFLFDYNIYTYKEQIYDHVRMIFSYYMYIYPKDNIIYYLSRDLRNFFYRNFQ